VLHKLVVSSIEESIDMDTFNEQKEQEQEDIERLKEIQTKFEEDGE
jgi:hypothetical protein